MKLKNPSVLITGAARRIGLELAKRSLSMGFDVVLHYRSDRRAADAWLAAHRSLRARVAFVQQDLTVSPASVVDAALEVAPSLAGLVNNAAIFTRGNFGDLVDLKTTLDTNTFAPLALCQRFAASNKAAWIVNITDAHIRPVSLSWQNYRLSKLLLEELTRQLAMLLAPRIRVNAIAPGPVLPAKNEATAFRALVAAMPLRRTVSIDSVANAYEFLVNSHDVTGEVIHVDGGWHLNG